MPVGKLLRFRDLRDRNIIRDWPSLKRAVTLRGFPPGRYLSPNVRVWTEEEVAEWIAALPPATASVRKGGEDARA